MYPPKWGNVDSKIKYHDQELKFPCPQFFIIFLAADATNLQHSLLHENYLGGEQTLDNPRMSHRHTGPIDWISLTKTEQEMRKKLSLT